MTWKRDPEAWAKIADLQKAGRSVTSIASELNIGSSTVRYALAANSGKQLNQDKDFSAEQLDRMELLCYRISKRKVRLA